MDAFPEPFIEIEHWRTLSVPDMFRQVVPVPEFAGLHFNHITVPYSGPLKRITCTESDNRPLLRISHIPRNQVAETMLDKDFV